MGPLNEGIDNEEADERHIVSDMPLLWEPQGIVQEWLMGRQQEKGRSQISSETRMLKLKSS